MSTRYKHRATVLRYAALLALMMCVGVNTAWGQATGLYYIANNNDKDPEYSSSTVSTNYYLVPASNGGEANIAINRWAWNDAAATPFVTTYQTNQDNNSIWVIKESETSGEYYLIHLLSGKYMTRNAGIGANSNRRAFHMEDPSTLGDDHLFNFTSHNGTPTYYSIKPKSLSSGYRFLNPSKANQAKYYGYSSQEAGVYIGGLIGTYNQNATVDRGSKWFLEPASLLTAPTISNVSASNTITITDANSLPSGYTIRYTTGDGSQDTPTASTGDEYSGPITVTDNWTVKAIVVRYGVVLTNVATKAVEPAVVAPTVTNNGDGTISLSTLTPNATMYYTIDGGVPTSSSQVYNEAFPLGNATVIKAITLFGSVFSDVTTYNVPQCDAPSISFNSATQEVTITSESTVYYNTGDGSQADPTTSSTAYSAPFTVSSGTTVKAIATHAGYLTSEVATLAITQVATPTIQGNGNNAISITSTTSGAIIYYTINGNDPVVGESYTFEYTEPLTEGVSGVTIKAIAVKENMINSAVGSGSVTLRYTAPTISFNSTTQQFTISSSEGATIYYTTNGNDPTTSIYSGTGSTTVTVTVSNVSSETTETTVKAIAIKAGYDASSVTTLSREHVAQPTIQNNGNNAISITSATPGATIYYTTNRNDPEVGASGTLQYNEPLTENVSGVTIKAIAVKADMINSAVGEGSVTLKCAKPVIRRSGAYFTITCATPGATIYYTYDTYPTAPADPTTSSSHISSGDIVSCILPVTVKAFAVASNYNSSDIVTANVLDDLEGSGTSVDPYLIDAQDRVDVFIAMANTAENASAYYKVTATSPLDFSDTDPITQPFTGTFDGGMQTITGLSHALFSTINGGTVKNVMLKDVSISSGTNVGAIANEVIGTSSNIASIYNCGILPSENGSSISGSGSVGSLVGELGQPGEGNEANCYARVINCFSYANITGGTSKGGIVGYNSYTSTSSDIRTMVMNCMFYGNIPSGGSPIYGGLIIDNNAANDGLNNFNYFSFDDFTGTISAYNCALGAEKRYLQRFEFHRYILNSNRELAALYATGNASDGAGVGSACKMAKWVLDKNIAPYPILKEQGYYPSVINYEDAPSLGTITISISQGSGCPTGASVNNSKTLTIYDKSIENHHYNYRTIRLPYYCEVGGTLNYTKNKVVTGWDVTVSGGSANFTDAADSKNFANRDANAYSRVFSQGAYLDIPEGASVSITAHWANCVYLSDPTYDVTYNTGYAATTVDAMPRYSNGDSYSINGDNQVVYTTFKNAIDKLSAGSGTVYDHAIVLVGNYHQFCNQTNLVNNTKLFTVMSADLNSDCEPDYSFFYQHTQRRPISPVRFDFLNFPGIGIGQKVNGTQNMAAQGIFRPRGWFEITNTCLVHFVQFEHDWTGKAANSPLILLGGIYDQFVSGNGGANGDNPGPYNHTSYIHLGSNAYFEEFSNGVHGDAAYATTRVPISVTGGEYKRFYLSGMFNPEAALDDTDKDAECYIDGGYFPEEVAGAGQEQIDGNVTWNIINADITNFYGGGINDAKPITGDITVNIKKSRVNLYCGGPKFGNMSSGKEVTTAATDCTFGKFFGAGYGGTSYYRYRTKNDYTKANYTWSTWAAEYERAYVAARHAISTSYEYEYVDRSGASDNTRVGRFYINYASLSLAETQDVSSTLTGCTIKSDFFGGGNLGKVNGDIVSRLTNCTVFGSVFGAGYSATVPTVDVWPTTGFVSVPSYNGDAGVYIAGDYPDTEAEGMVVYTWSSEGSTDSPFTDNGSTHSIYTDQDLTSLGQVVGNATLTIDGNTYVQGIVHGTFNNNGVLTGTISGGVFGGGDASDALGNTEVNIDASGLQGSYTYNTYNVFGGGNEANVGGSVTVNIEQGVVSHNVYGGGALANTNTNNDNGTPSYTTSTNKTSVNLHGGTISGNVFGGGLGDRTNNVEAIVYGDVEVSINKENTDDCIVSGDIFGCNDQNGTPKGSVTVHVYRTQGWTNHDVSDGKKDDTVEKTGTVYELHAVYGGGNLAGYVPVSDNGKTIVIIDGCDKTSIEYVYGGGNAASVPATDVEINGSYEIGWVFGGGNGKDNLPDDSPNPGANVGYYAYTIGTEATPQEIEDIKDEAQYGTGITNVKLFGGTIHKAFGGSNTKGNVRYEAEVSVDKSGKDCALLIIDEVFGAGNEAPMDGTSHIELGCVDYLDEIYGGANDADVYSDVVLNIQSGSFGRVFGGNNKGGTIHGTIIVNIEETGCMPVVIGQLYGGGNDAPYTAPAGEHGPTINIKSFTSIGEVYGGGLGANAVVTGDTYVKINEALVTSAILNDLNQANGTNYELHSTKTYSGNANFPLPGGKSVVVPERTVENDEPTMGVIGVVYGGGNAAIVDGDTYVYIATRSTVDMETIQKNLDVVGANITGNIYGGGNSADVTGQTHVQIGPGD